MKILLLTIGSRGDVQPFVALGQGLVAAGHDVTVATCARFQGFIESHGLAYGFISDDLLKIVDSDQGKALMEDTRGILKIVMANIRLARQISPIQQRAVDQSWDVAQEVLPDLVCFHPKALLGPAIAEKLQIPGIMASPLPFLVPTSEYPCMGFPALPLGGWYNRLTYKIVHVMIRAFAGKYVRIWRRRTNTTAPRTNLALLHDQAGRPIPALHAFSRYVLPEPTDWPETAVAAGYWFLDAKEDWTPPSELTDFLEAGPPPIYVGFGSMSGRDPQRLSLAFVEALQRGGHRGILATGWGGLDAVDLPNTILRIDEAPHDWLFPRVAAVVHHGGAGSTAAGLRAGKPTLICPFFADQPFWGSTVQLSGAGPEPIPQKNVSAETLAPALEQLVSNIEMREKAETIAAGLAQEDGVANAVNFIECVASSHRARST